MLGPQRLIRKHSIWTNDCGCCA